MKEATLVYPHQLFKKSPAIEKGRVIFLIEDALLLTHNPIHRQKLLLHKLSMDSYQTNLESDGYDVRRISINEFPTTLSVFSHLRLQGVEKIHVVDTTDTYLEKEITKSRLERVWYDSPLFILTKEDAVARYVASKKHMAAFYKQLRKDKDILLDKEGSPTGGKWSFDEDNRKKIPRGTTLPTDISMYANEDTVAAEKWVAEIEAEKYGESGCWLPYTHAGAEEYLQNFFEERFSNFGTYEDAMTSGGTRLWHSTLSPLINIGLLTPEYVLGEAVSYAEKNDVPLNSLEGFVRQLLGWREFIRASYECEGSLMRTQNFWNHTRSLPSSFWNGNTEVLPLDDAVKTALKYGYNHHIERLMVLGNFMLLSKTKPDEVYRWFMGMYVDAYDWVMVPNVYGMSQFADGGSFATKPYISGSNYLKKMSDYPTGDWEELWTALYWNFINDNMEFFKSNHRLSMMPRILEKMDTKKRNSYEKITQDYFSK